MKNLFKLGFLAIVMCLCLTACDLFDTKPKAAVTANQKPDSIGIDSVKTDSLHTNSTKINADSSKISKQ